jgi:tetratricopeptide (TPR) repeat protein
LLKAADSSVQFFQILQLVDQKRYPEAIAGYEQYMQVAPPWFQGPIQFEIATLQAAEGNKQEALETLETAIQSGFDDCFAVELYPEWNTFRDNSQFAMLHAKMRISEADYKELAWLKAEIENLNHTTGTAEAEIPARQTTSAAVLFNRERLKIMQEKYVAGMKFTIQERKFTASSSFDTEPKPCIEFSH